MSGDRQWTIAGSPHRHEMDVIGGPVLDHCSPIAVVEASRLTAVEAERDVLRTERDAYREALERFRRAVDALSPGTRAHSTALVVAEEADAVLARYPKNETEQG